MSHRYSEDEAIAAIASLTRARLRAFIEMEIISPLHSEAGPVFRQLDLVRLELLCELSEDFDLEDDALGVVISLIDQLHAARGDLCALVAAIEAEPEEVRARIASAWRKTRSGGGQ